MFRNVNLVLQVCLSVVSLILHATEFRQSTSVIEILLNIVFRSTMHISCIKTFPPADRAILFSASGNIRSFSSTSAVQADFIAILDLIQRPHSDKDDACSSVPFQMMLIHFLKCPFDWLCIRSFHIALCR